MANFYTNNQKIDSNMNTKLFYLLCMLSLMAGCRVAEKPEIGQWRAVLIPDSTRPGLEIPFNLEIRQPGDSALVAVISNAGENLLVKEVTLTGDSILFNLPFFEGTIQAHIKKNRLDGTYTHRASGRAWSVPFYADFGITDRFPRYTDKPAGKISGRWEVTVRSGNQAEKQIGEFQQEGSQLTGTFLSTTGDYRFLQGKVAGTKMFLSGFDGAHALVFQADLKPDGTLANGIFCGGPSWKGEWNAIRNDTVTLPDPTTLTFLKPGFDRLDFTFSDLDGKPVSLSDPQLAGKAIIVQIIGSWCPNCLDETRYLTELYKEFHSQGLEIVALCYESSDRDKSIKAIRRFRDNIGAEYIFLYAGESNKRKAGETLPMLNRIVSFPTSIFIDRSGKVRKIFTGFSGPGTGSHYTELTGEMRKTAGELILE
jgi:thiol-disulfide isomerase/thioredoxin